MTLICVNKIDKEMTLTELLKTKMTDEEVEKFIKNYKRLDLPDFKKRINETPFDPSDFRHVVMCAFVFSHSEEGHDYWADIANR